MPARSIGSATVSFGLVSIPVRMYVATHSEQPSFNLIHGVCKSRIKQQTWCPRCERVVKGGDKAYQLLAEAMRDTGMVALAQHVSRGKERLVLIRPFADGLALHTLYYADEVLSFDDVERGPKAAVKPAETTLARKLIEQLAAETFAPEQYHDHWRERLQEAVDRKVTG